MARKRPTIEEFDGMRNTRSAEGEINEPRIILNADRRPEGGLEKRDGATHAVAFADGHSLWACDLCMLGVDNLALYRIQGASRTSIGTLTAPKLPVSYEEAEGRVYWSNRYGHGTYLPADGSARAWGLDPPASPILSATTGNLPAGTYRVCMTATGEAGQDISGSGLIAQIEVSADAGISISNRGGTDLVWMTDPDGSEFFYVGAQDTIVSTPQAVEPLPSFLCSPPPYLENLCYAFGRMWGTRGSRMYYSMAFHPEWWRLSFDYFDLDGEGAMIAKTDDGLFVSDTSFTRFYPGRDPAKMAEQGKWPAAIPGTLQYCHDVKELGDVLSPTEKVHQNTPVWVSKHGVVMGNRAGRVFNLTQGRVKFAPGDRGASLYRQKDGHFQFLTSFRSGTTGSGLGFSDDATLEVIRNGRVFEE